MIKNLILVFAIAFQFLSMACKEVAQEKGIRSSKNEVLILGTIHSGHFTDSIYTTNYLDKLIRKINPDYILAEIPPDRIEEAMSGFKRDDSISEPRVMRFPEYTDVVFPLTKEMDFKIIATAGWTKSMADKRTAKLKASSKKSVSYRARPFEAAP